MKMKLPGEGRTHLLVLFSGPCGAGKTRLARWLHKRLTDEGESVQILFEPDVYAVGELQSFRDQWNKA